jgi:hypothetical protein
MTRTARASLTTLALLLTVAASALGQDRAQEVLAQARAAMGNKGALTGVSSLAVGASVRRVVPAVGIELTSDVQLEFLLPDKYRRTENISIGAMTRTISMGLNGADLFYDDGGAAAMTGIDPKAPGPVRDQIIKGLKEDVFRMVMVLLLAPPSNLACTLTSGGVAEAPDGKADVVDVKGPDKLNLTESIDADQLKELTQKAIAKAQADPGNAAKVAQEMREETEKMPKKMITIQMHFSDPKAFGAVTLPSKMSVEGGPQGTEEWTFSSLKVNAPLKPERFTK